MSAAGRVGMLLQRATANQQGSGSCHFSWPYYWVGLLSILVVSHIVCGFYSGSWGVCD